MNELASNFHKNNKKLYIVGGFCRDKILNINNSKTDIDFTTDALPNEVQKITKCIWHIGKKYGTQLLLHEWKTYEITTFRSDIWILDNRKPVDVTFTTDINLDANRRDFTCNAIYYNPISEQYIDPLKWIDDLKNRVIRFVWNSEERIKEDALRILRFVRFKNKYSLSPAQKDYFDVMKNNIWLLKNISRERIKEELDKILLWKNNTQALRNLKEIWFFTVYLEELNKQSETPGNSHHLEGDVWIHTLMTIEYLNTMDLDKYSRWDTLDLYWAMLLHDITKPICFSQDSKWEWHYYWHEKSGAEYVKQVVAKQLPFPKKSIKKISWIIENHLRIFKVFEMKKLKSRTLMMHKYWPILMIIAEADHMWRVPANYNLIEQLHSFYNNFLKVLQHKTFYTGKDIIREFPHLQATAIWNKLKEINNKILIDDNNKD